jgi:septal ring factor EnvC (AmiA/AmiB activator)
MNLKQLLEARSKAMAGAEKALADGQTEEFDRLEAEVRGLDSQIAEAEARETRAAELRATGQKLAAAAKQPTVEPVREGRSPLVVAGADPESEPARPLPGGGGDHQVIAHHLRL